MCCIIKTANIETLSQIILFMTYLRAVSTTAFRHRSIKPKRNYFRFLKNTFLISPLTPPAPHISFFHVLFVNSIFLNTLRPISIAVCTWCGAQRSKHRQPNSSHNPKRKEAPVPEAILCPQPALLQCPWLPVPQEG